MVSIKSKKLEILFHWNRCVAWHCTETCISSLEWFGPTVTKLCSGKGNPDADAAADESSPYMAPFQATQKQLHIFSMTGIKRGMSL